MPLNPTSDQGLIGDVVELAGLGRRISTRSDTAEIRREVARLLQNAAVQHRSQTTAARSAPLHPVRKSQQIESSKRLATERDALSLEGTRTSGSESA